jgi:hypothetical protein
MADDAEANISAQIGRSLSFPIVVVLADKLPDGPEWNEATLAWTWPVWDGAERPGLCPIRIPPHATQAKYEPVMRWVVTHEVWHCFQAALVDQAHYAGAHSLPQWVREGQAAWVAEAIAQAKGYAQPDLERQHWLRYVLKPEQPLFNRDYDAVGFYAQLQHRGIDPWNVLDAMLIGGTSSDDAALKASGATDPGFTEGWGSSWFRDPQPSQAWAMGDGYGIPADAATPQSIALGDGDQGSISAPSNAGGIATLHSTAFVTHVEVSGVGRLADPGGSLDTVLSASQMDLCTSQGGDCTCPPGSPNSPQAPPTAPSDLRLAVTGQPTNSSIMSVRGISKDDWCGRKPLTPTPTTSGGGRSMCDSLLPAAEVQEKLGISLGELLEGSPVGIFNVVCAWPHGGAKGWELAARLKTAGPVNPNAFGIGCQVAGGTTNIAYCINAGEGFAGGNVFTRRWSMIVGTSGISIDQYINVLLPILARTGG